MLENLLKNIGPIQIPEEKLKETTILKDGKAIPFDLYVRLLIVEVLEEIVKED